MRHGVFLVFFCLFGVLPAHAQEVIRKTLISAKGNVQAGAWKVTNHDLGIDRPKLPFSLEYKPLHGGKQEGTHLLLVDNGLLQITILPERGMGILSVVLDRMKPNIRLGWDSPVKEVVHPKFVNLQARGGLGWLDGFNEWLVRGGLENNGQPGQDKFINNVGDEATMDLTLHGKIANIPAAEVEVVIDPKTERISVRGMVHERMLFGPKLELATEISTMVGSTNFQVKDIVTNRGAQEQEFQMLYHVNYGKPLLEEGATFLAPLERVTPYNTNAARDVKRFNTYSAPTAGYVEQVYLLKPRANAKGRTTILLKNKAGDQASSMTYAVNQLPYLTLWKNTGAEADGYVTGLEPATNYPNPRRVERQFGRVPKLAAGASRTFTIEYGLHSGAEQVREVVERVERLQGPQAPQIDLEPQGKK